VGGSGRLPVAPLMAGHTAASRAPKADSRGFWPRPESALAQTRQTAGSKVQVFLSSQFWPIPSTSRRVVNSAKLCLNHPFSRIKWIGQWAVDRDPVSTLTTLAKTKKTAILCTELVHSTCTLKVDKDRMGGKASSTLEAQF